MRRITCVVACVLGCGDDDPSSPPDAAVADAAADANPHPAEWASGYVRVLPGYDTEAMCRAANPDPLIHCTELLSLCADGRAFALHTDIVTGGTWSASSSTEANVMLQEAAFSMDGMFVLTRDGQGAVSSSEIYGNRAFERDADSLCP